MDKYTPDLFEAIEYLGNYVNLILPLEGRLNSSLMLDIFCKNRINMFGIWSENQSLLGYGVYPISSFYNHSCWPNISFKTNFGGVPQLEFFTVSHIPKNGELTISYIDLLDSVTNRRDLLKDKYFFDCQCERCLLHLSHQPDHYLTQENYWTKYFNLL